MSSPHCNDRSAPPRSPPRIAASRASGAEAGGPVHFPPQESDPGGPHCVDLADMTGAAAQSVLAVFGQHWGDMAGVAHTRVDAPDECAAAVLCVPLVDQTGSIPIAESLGHLHLGHIHRPGDGGTHGPDIACRVALLADVLVLTVVNQVLAREAAKERLRSEQLYSALQSSRAIGMALGVVMAQHKLTSDDALMALTRASNIQNRKLRDVADEVWRTGAIPTRCGNASSGAERSDDAANTPR